MSLLKYFGGDNREEASEPASSAYRYIPQSFGNPKQCIKLPVISLSANTEIPGAYLTWFLMATQEGYIEVDGSTVSLDKRDVSLIVWHSKNYSLWIKEYEKKSSRLREYRNHMFNFTINDDAYGLESGVALSLLSASVQLHYLCATFGPALVNLRFEPVVYYEEGGVRKNNMTSFRNVVQLGHFCGLKEIITSFCVPYSNTLKRMNTNGKKLTILTVRQKIEILKWMQKICAQNGMTLALCREEEAHLMPLADMGVKVACCVDNEKLLSAGIRLGHTSSTTRLQRPPGKMRCDCIPSEEIVGAGKPCTFGCDYCFAEDILDASLRKRKCEDIGDIEDDYLVE